MAERERLSADVRREQLMAAAVELLAERGYDAVTAADIAQRAGVSKGLLWHYFPDLDTLFELTARRTLGKLTLAVANRIDLEASAPTVIRSAVRAAAGLRLTHDAERRAMREIIVNLRTAEGDLRFSQADLRDLYAAQAGIFRRGQEEGLVRPTLDPQILAVVYQGAVDSMLGFLDANPEADTDAFVETVADVLLHGVTPDDRPR